jgi:hypothetical protein
MTPVRGRRAQGLRGGPRSAAISRRVVLLCWIVAALALAPTAAARLTPIVPPSNGAGNVYLETLPGPGGSQALGSAGGTAALNGSASGGTRTSSAGQATGTSQGVATSPAARQALAGNGHATRVVRNLAPQSRPRVPLSDQATKAESPAGSIGKLVVGHGRSGLGVALPLILGAATVAAIAFALRRRLG